MSQKRSSGITLIEMGLVLMIAAAIIVLSIRYYRTATAEQKAAAIMAQIQQINQAMEDLSGGLPYTSLGTNAAIASALNSVLKWPGACPGCGTPTIGYAASGGGASVSVWAQPGEQAVPASGSPAYEVGFYPLSTDVCTLLYSQLSSGNSHLSFPQGSLCAANNPPYPWFYYVYTR